jgi:SAM-dependent methyltransferase
MDFDKYRRLGDYHWREYARPTVYRAYVDGLRDWVKGSAILDVGAGDGLIAYVIGATGIELDPIAVALARSHAVDVIKGDAGALPFPAASFDTVFLGDVIEHLEDPLPALLEARRVLRNDGTLYVTTPPEHTPVRPYHYREYTPDSLRETVEPLGFELSAPMFTRHDRIHAAFSKTSHAVR